MQDQRKVQYQQIVSFVITALLVFVSLAVVNPRESNQHRVHSIYESTINPGEIITPQLSCVSYTAEALSSTSEKGGLMIQEPLPTLTGYRDAVVNGQVRYGREMLHGDWRGTTSQFLENAGVMVTRPKLYLPPNLLAIRRIEGEYTFFLTSIQIGKPE